MLLRGLTLPASTLTSPAPFAAAAPSAGDLIDEPATLCAKGDSPTVVGSRGGVRPMTRPALRVTAASKARAGDGCFAAACGGPSMLFMIFIICSSK